VSESKSLDEIGNKSTEIPVEISARFLEQFSAQLYSSPQKAFEELISNGWDAGATHVDVRIAEDLKANDATFSVLDNGHSMNEQGLRELWHIAFSPKRDNRIQHGRHVVGKFGIGKLATYVLADNLTYICKASDGQIRRVTMDFKTVEDDLPGGTPKLVHELKLGVYDVSMDEVREAVSAISGGADVLKVLSEGFSNSLIDASDDEYLSTTDSVEPPSSETWTLAVLSGLKPEGRRLKRGILQRMLMTALPLSSHMRVDVNGIQLTSTKSAVPLTREWVIGKDLEISSIEIDPIESDSAEDDVTLKEKNGDKEAEGASEKSRKDVIPVVKGDGEHPYVEIAGVGPITGKVKLYSERISGGKSDDHAASNGFFVNVLGRVVNEQEPAFGERNLSHAAWARFRMTVRADGLNASLLTNRENLREDKSVKIFRAFLRKAFNVARSAYDSDDNSGIPDGGSALVKSLGVVSLNSLKGVVGEALKSGSSSSRTVDIGDLKDFEGARETWHSDVSDNIGNALDEVKIEKSDGNDFARFRVSDRSIVVNKEHPFTLEHSNTKAEKKLLSAIAMVEVLTDIYAMDIGISQEMLLQIQEYRDKLKRFNSIKNRRSGAHIARLLAGAQHNSSKSKELEEAVSASLRFLGFSVKDMGKSGQPEGIARAYALPSNAEGSDGGKNLPLYSVAFDAKSTKHNAASTGNINISGIAGHRRKFNADYSLVVAPGYQDGSICDQCVHNEVTPMTTNDLGKLLECTAEHGAIPLTMIREVFNYYRPEEVVTWVTQVVDKVSSSRPLSIDLFLKALDILKDKVPDTLSPSLISFQIREALGVSSVRDSDVVSLVRGISVLVPDLIGMDGPEKIIVNASAERVGEAIRVQLERVRGSDEKGDDA